MRQGRDLSEPNGSHGRTRANPRLAPAGPCGLSKASGTGVPSPWQSSVKDVCKEALQSQEGFPFLPSREVSYREYERAQLRCNLCKYSAAASPCR